MIFAAALIVLSGVYTVESYEVAVVLRFGRLVGNTPEEQIRLPGLHFAFPFFIDEVIRVPAHTVHERVVSTHYSPGRLSHLVRQSGYLLTGDNNIVLMRATVRYQISDAAQYVIFSHDTASMIDGIVSGEMTRIVTTMEIDTVLTAGRAEIGREILASSQTILDEMNIGVAIIGIELTDILPPNEASDSFEAVRSASIAAEARVQEARGCPLTAM